MTAFIDGYREKASNLYQERQKSLFFREVAYIMKIDHRRIFTKCIKLSSKVTQYIHKIKKITRLSA